MLVGRQAELRLLEALLDEGRRGRSGTLAIVGDPGVGKTALLEEARRQASDMRVLSATGVETESELPFAALHELLRSLLDLLPRIPAAQARAVSAALALEEGKPDPLAVGAGTLSLLVEAAEETPVAVLLDDAHWVDRASADALLFAARRLRLEQIAVVVAFRTASASNFDHLPRLELEPLEPEDARTLLRTRAKRVPPAAEASVIAAAAGNPLALLELPVELAQDLPVPKSSYDRLQRTFAQRIDGLPAEARRGLLLAAAEPDLATVRRAAQLQGLEDPLGPAEEAGLVRIDGGTLAFRHPVVRSLVYASSPAADRSAAHRALAEALAGEAESDRRAWHLAAAAEGPDEEVAALLEATAARAAGRGGYAVQASALERAARLSQDPDDASRRLANAVLAASSAGDLDRALRLADEAVACARDPHVRAKAVLEQTVALGRANPGAYDQERFLAAIGDIEQLEPKLATRVLEQVVNRRNEALDLAGSKELAPQLERAARRSDQRTMERALGGVADVCLACGDRENFARLFADFRHSTYAVTSSAIDLTWAEEYDTVRHALETEARVGQSGGELLRILWVDTCTAHLELRLGRLNEAKLAASKAVTLTDASGLPRFGVVALCVLANVHAWQGEAAACRRHAAEAIAIARDGRLVLFEFGSRAALGLLALGTGGAAEAIEVLEPVARRWEESMLVEPGPVSFVPDLVEACVLSGRTADALHWLERFSTAARTAERTWALAACARCEGLLAAADAFDEPFGRALELLDGSPLVLERARAQLAYGERLRRQTRKKEARVHLREAYEAFASVSAVPWQTRALGELRATGERVADAAPPVPALTPQELHIATLVADGKTNKEIAAAMYLSPKTVEYHLANAYRKLDIHSRAELARLVTREAQTSPS